MTANHFDWISRHYDHLSSERTREFWNTIIAGKVKGRLLDAGGGTGRLSQAFAGEASLVVVVDESRGMLRQAVEKPGLHAVRARTEALPFIGESFEVVLMVDALHHVADPQASASEMARVVERGGQVLIEEPDITRWQVRLIALAEKILRMRSRFLRPEDITGLFTGGTAQVIPGQTELSKFVNFTK